MKPFVSAFVLALAATSLLACNDPESPEGTRLQPYRTDWRVEAEIPFPYVSQDGMVQISSVRIGGREHRENFANRGDVIVEFEEGRSTIKIEMRRFTMSTSPAGAEEDFEALSLWAYNNNQASPRKPGEMDQERNCAVWDDNNMVWLPWKDDCAIRVYYDGQSQLARAGADLRVTLPAEYRHTIRIVTEDMDDDSDYINRGTVCVNNLKGSAEIDLDNGTASVIYADDVQPIPICSAAQIQACEDYVHEDEPAPWHADCPCVFETQSSWGSLRAESRDAAAANITVDVPAGFWMNVTARNDGTQQTQAGVHCKALVEVPDFEIEDQPFPWSVRGIAAKPSALATGGYGMTVISKDCSPVAFTPTPNDFVGYGNGHEQTVEQRGDIRICAGCLRGQSCNDLIDG